MKTLRLLITEECPRSCEGCCNNKWDLSKLEIESNFKKYDMVVLTGGEPMLYPDKIVEYAKTVKKDNPKAKVIVYTAMPWNYRDLSTVIKHVDGITVTLHEQADEMRFSDLLISINPRIFLKKSLRLNVFEGVTFTSLINYYLEFYKRTYNIEWDIKKMVWVEDCSVPKNEVFMRGAL